MWRALAAGLNYSIPGNGGPNCLAYTGTLQRFSETLVVSTLCIAGLYWCYPLLKFPLSDDEGVAWKKRSSRDSASRVPEFTVFRRILIASLCLIFGAQIGYKLISESLIYLLNPCHIVTAIQILLLLCYPSGRWVTFLFRLHLYTLSGATLAIVFPILNSLALPYEVYLYYVQHCTILLVPMYLLTYGGSFSIEELADPFWPVVIACMLFLYHFIFLQMFSIMSMANLNNMMCPAVSDPFHGRFYRLWAVGHQSLYIPLHGKLYSLLARAILSTLGSLQSGTSKLLGDNNDSTSLNGTVSMTNSCENFCNDTDFSAIKQPHCKIQNGSIHCALAKGSNSKAD